MNGILLVARTGMDDVPLRLFASDVACRHFLQFSKGSFDEMLDKACERLDWPSNDLVSIDCIEFKDGVPIKSWHVMRVDIET